MFSIIVIIIITFIGVIDCNNDSTIEGMFGDYSQYIPNYNLCGLSRNLFEKPNECFEYQPKRFSAISDAREAMRGESPWTVFISSAPCTGSLIAPQWVLTAAHCFDGEKQDIKIYFGTEYMRGEYFSVSKDPVIHPNYIPGPAYLQDPGVDLALVQLDRPVQIVNNGEYFTVNIICLPRIQTNEMANDEYAYQFLNHTTLFMSGWGRHHDYRLRLTARKAQCHELYIGPDGRLSPPRCINSLPHFWYRDKGVNHREKACKGDSGSPSWLNYGFRAVQMGILVHIYGRSGCSNGATHVFVPAHVKWIIDTIKQ